MNLDLMIRAPRAIVDGAERACAVGVAEGRIAVLTPLDDAPAAALRVDLGPDEVLLPGLVDTHVHVNEPGRTEWEGFATATAAAAAGGVTTLLDMPLNSIPVTTTVEALRVKQDAARGRVSVDVGFWGGAVPGNLADLAPLHEAGVFGMKCFLLDSGIAEFAPLDDAGLRSALRELAPLGALLIAHAEDADVIDAAPAPHGRDYATFLRSRPPAAERRAIDRVVAATRETGGRTHVVHLSDAGAVPALRAARAGGVDVSAETCPHYLTLDAAHVPDGATAFKCCPPIRDTANQDALWAALDDVVDMVVSDHSPCPVELKRPDTGDFGQAWGGVASLQLGLPVVWSAARRRGYGLADVVRWMSAAPARRVGLTGKGRLAPGADADLCVLAPEETFVVDPARLHHRNPVSAYAGQRLSGVVRRTWLRGRPVDGQDGPRGRLLTRGRA